MTQLTSLRDQVGSQTRDPNFRIRPVTTVDRAINTACATIQQELEGFIESSQQSSTIAGIAGTREYLLDSIIQTLQTIKRDDRPLILTTKHQIDQNSLSVTTGSPIYYYVRGSYIGLYPVPANNGTIYLDYTGRLPTLTEGQDFDGSEILVNLIVLKASSILFKQVQKLAEAQICDEEYMKACDLARYGLRRDDNLSYGDQDNGMYLYNPKGINY